MVVMSPSNGRAISPAGHFQSLKGSSRKWVRRCPGVQGGESHQEALALRDFPPSTGLTFENFKCTHRPKEHQAAAGKETNLTEIYPLALAIALVESLFPHSLRVPPLCTAFLACQKNAFQRKPKPRASFRLFSCGRRSSRSTPETGRPMALTMPNFLRPSRCLVAGLRHHAWNGLARVL